MKGFPKVPYAQIKKMVFKTDGTKPSQGAMSEAAKNFKVEKKVNNHFHIFIYAPPYVTTNFSGYKAG